MVFHSRRKLCSSENLKTSNSFVDFRLRAVRASLGHGDLPPKRKTTASESSDTWDCHYRSSHRRAFALPAGVDCPPAPINHCDSSIKLCRVDTLHHLSEGNTRRLLVD